MRNVYSLFIYYCFTYTIDIYEYESQADTLSYPMWNKIQTGINERYHQW
jgi:hypothetical protein